MGTDIYSDGQTPDEVIKQILQIHAVIPGQKPDRQFNIPQRNNSIQQPADQQQTAQLLRLLCGLLLLQS